jgi:signal transduction histidine kinase
MSEASRAIVTSPYSVERWSEPSRQPSSRPSNELMPNMAEAPRPARRMGDVTHLVGGIAHDLGNHLHLAISSLEAMQRYGHRLGRTDEMDCLIEEALRSTLGAAALGKRLVTFALPRELKLEPLCVNAVVADMEALLRSRLGSKTELDLRLGEHLPRIPSVRHELENALLNLAINARDAMPEGGTLSIKTSAIAAVDPIRRAAYVSIRVRDTGCGMTPNVLARACEPLYTTKPPDQGTGLGLWMVRRFVRDLNGRIEIDSLPDVGTNVTLLLPSRLAIAKRQLRNPHPRHQPHRSVEA